MLVKNDFFEGAIKSDCLADLEINYAYEHYAHLNFLQPKKYWMKKGSVSMSLLDIEDIGTIAFHYLPNAIMHYIQEQSCYWDENFYIFDGRPIVDESVYAFDSFPRLLQRRFFEKTGKLNEENGKLILNFVDWALHNLDNFNGKIFLDKEVSRKEYQKLRDSLILILKVS